MGTKYEHLLDTCYEMATNLPAEIAENSVITGETFGTVKLGEVKMFTKCCEKAKTNFGPMEDILQETQLTEHEFFPLVMQLLHGKEMDYMTGGMEAAQLIQRWTDLAWGRLAPVLALNCNYQPSSMLEKLAMFLCQ